MSRLILALVVLAAACTHPAAPPQGDPGKSSIGNIRQRVPVVADSVVYHPGVHVQSLSNFR